MHPFSLLSNAKPAAILLLLGGLLASSNVFAQATTSGADDKIWTGAVCVPSGGNAWTSVKIRPTGIENVASVARYIACAVTVDAEDRWNLADNNGGTDSGYGALYLTFDFSTAASATVTCTAQVISTAGTIVETASNSVNGTAGDASVYMGLPVLYLGDGNSSAVGFNCLLPPGVKLTVINLEEYADTHQPTVFP